MSRFFAPISKQHLHAKLLDQFGEDDGDERYICHHNLKEGLGKDLKVSFSLENTFMGLSAEGGLDKPGELIGLHTRPTDLTFLGIMSGGDWEVSVFWIVYWDGKRLRAYVPTEGNPWNSKTREAYGNDDEADLKDARRKWPDYPADAESIESGDIDHEPELILKDIDARILPQPRRVRRR